MTSSYVPISNKKNSYMWSIAQIALFSFLLGPIGACYLMGKNYKAAGRADWANVAYIIGVIGSPLLLSLSMAMPSESLQINSILGCELLIVAFAYVYQKGMIEEKLSQGCQRYSFLWSTWTFLYISALQVAIFIFYILMQVLSHHG